MASAQTVWGIDVGKCALKAVRLKAAGDGKVEILATDLITHAKILTQPDANREELISAALEKFLSRNDISNDKVVVSVPGQHTLARFSKLPPLEEKKIPDIVRYEADQQIPFDIDEVIWDYQVFREEDSPDMEVGIFAMKREWIRSHLIHFENAGIEPFIVQSSPLALFNTAAVDGLLGDETTVILDIGAENTDLVVATPWSLWTRTIPLGGNKFTDALVKSFKLSFSKAENLKQTAGSSKYARQIFQSMRPIFADLVQELQRSIGFYTSTHRQAKLTKCLAMGSAFKLPGLQKYLQQNLSLTVSRPDKYQNTVESAAAKESQFTDNVLSFGVAYGLALQGLGLAKVNSSLLPPEIAKQAVWRKKRPFFGAAAACLLLASGAIWMRYVSDTSALAAGRGSEPGSISPERARQIIDSDLPAGTPPREYTKTVLAAAQSLQREYRQLKSQGEDELATIEQVLKLQQNRFLIPKLLEIIHQALPQPAEPLVQAQTPDEYLKAIQDDPAALRRSAREQVFIERLDIEHEVDAFNVELEDQSGARDVDEVPVTDSMNTEGFIVTLNCRTPNRQEVKFVSETIMKRLRELGREPGMGFFINRVVLPGGERLVAEKSDDTSAKSSAKRTGRTGRTRPPAGRGARTGRGAGRGRAFGSRRGAPAKPKPKADDAHYIDPLTNEPMDKDWGFSIQFDVLLSDAPQVETEDNDESAEDAET
ncbi:MAG: type IV pilus assembly protein PilM [Phycisphaerae bacterium]